MQVYMHYGQVANFKTNSTLEIEKFPIAINSKIKKSIVIKEAKEVDERFHSRYCCKEKTYRYIIDNSKYGTAIHRNFSYHVPQKLNIENMKKATTYFEGEHDFKAFKASGTSSKSSVRTIYGTLVEVGLGKINPEEIPEIIKNGDRQKAGKTLPAHGLYLVKVEYR